MANVTADIGVAADRQCPSPRGSLYEPDKRIVYRAGCGRWSCPPCAKRKSARLARRFERIRWSRQPALVTITAALVEDADPTPEAMRRFARRVSSLRRAVVSLVGKFNWAWVREVSERHPDCRCNAPHPSPDCDCLFCQWANHETMACAQKNLADDLVARKLNAYREIRACRCGLGGGRLHVHMLWDARFIPQAALSRIAARCHLGAVIDVRRVSAKGSARYVSKYLTKSNFPARARMRRFAIRAPEPSRDPTTWCWSPYIPAFLAVDRLGCVEIDYDAEGWCAYDPTQAGQGRRVESG